MKTLSTVPLLFACAAAAPVFAQALGANAHSSTPDPIPTSIVYRNTEYGFCFRLPADWKGYTIVTEQWRGTVFSADGSSQEGTVFGPQLLIRNPKWTDEEPYQDIPIMVFTPKQWQMVDDDRVSVSAAPIGPSGLGRNSKYVFALPPRSIGSWSDLKGIDEVEALMRRNPFEAPCGHKTQPAKKLP
jgi:hypothetical protein